MFVFMSNYKGYVCLVAGFLMMLCLGTVYSWSVFRSPIEAHFQITSLLSGLPYMTSLVFYSLFMVFTGRNRHKMSLKKWMLLGAVMVGLGWILSSFTSHIILFTLSYGVMIGTGVGIMYGIPMALVAEWFPMKKGLMVGLVLGGFGLSALISAPLARFLIESRGLMPAFLYIGIAFLIILLLLTSLMNSPEGSTCSVEIDNSATLSAQVDSKEMLRLRSFKVLYFCYFIGTAIGLTMIGLSYPIGVDYIQASPSVVAWMLSVFALCNGLGRPFFGWFTDRFSPLSSIRLSFGVILLAISLMLIFKESSVLVFGICFSLFWFNLGGWLALAPAATLRFYGVCHFSQNYGLMFSAYGAGALFGVVASGFLKDWLGTYQAIFWLVLVLAGMGLLSSYYFRSSIDS
jgi:MFS transporter, OFA family, oxalate/formate antiporter